MLSLAVAVGVAQVLGWWLVWRPKLAAHDNQNDRKNVDRPALGPVILALSASAIENAGANLFGLSRTTLRISESERMACTLGWAFLNGLAEAVRLGRGRVNGQRTMAEIHDALHEYVLQERGDVAEASARAKKKKRSRARRRARRKNPRDCSCC